MAGKLVEEYSKNLCTVCSIILEAQTKFLLFSVKLIGYNISAVNVVPSNPCIGPLARMKIYVFLLSKCAEEPISTTKSITK